MIQDGFSSRDTALSMASALTSVSAGRTMSSTIKGLQADKCEYIRGHKWQPLVSVMTTVKSRASSLAYWLINARNDGFGKLITLSTRLLVLENYAFVKNLCGSLCCAWPCNEHKTEAPSLQKHASYAEIHTVIRKQVVNNFAYLPLQVMQAPSTTDENVEVHAE